MPRTITKTVYTFQELLDLRAAGKATERAVEKAREWLRNAQTDGEWYEFVFDTWKEAMEQIGFGEPKLYFRGFWSQGDGACFTSNSIDLAKLIDFLATEIKAKNCIEGDPEDFRPWLVHKLGGKPTNTRYAKLRRIVDSIRDCTVESIDHHYSHSNTCRFRAELYDRGEASGTGKDWKWHSRTPAVRKLFDEFAEAAEDLRKGLSDALYHDLEEEYEYLTSDEALLELASGNDYAFTIHGEWER